jgi:hypothetical protein
MAYFAGFAMLGSVIFDGLDYVGAIRSNNGHLPDALSTPWALASIPIRAAASGVLGAVLGASGMLTPTPASAFIVGVAAPSVLERLTSSASTLVRDGGG